MIFKSDIYPYTWDERFLLKGKTYREKSSKKEYSIHSFTITDMENLLAKYEFYL